MSNWKIPGTKTILVNVHAENGRCRVGSCVIHNRSKNSIMNAEEWPYNWNHDTLQIERVCIHGVGHPDSDVAAHLIRTGQDAFLVHGCDGCCKREVSV